MTSEQIQHTAKFVWDDGHGETSCSADYFETRCLQRVALGKAAEARLANNESVAADFEAKARSHALRLDEMRRSGHIGPNVRYRPE